MQNSDSWKRLQEFEEKKRERLEAKQRYRDTLKRMWDAQEAVFLCEQTLKNEAPSNPDEPLSWRMCVALKYLTELREHRDRLIDEAQKAK